MTCLTGVGSYFCASHEAKGGGIHGHTWEVIAWFPAGADALMLKSQLDTFCAEQFDHKILEYPSGSGEWLAETIGRSLNECVCVDISRPVERIYARWEQKP